MIVCCTGLRRLIATAGGIVIKQPRAARTRRPPVACSRSFLCLSLAFCLCLAFAGHSEATDCVRPDFKFCDKCQIKAPVTVGVNTECMLSLNGKIGLVSVQITSPASHGFAGVEQGTRPQPGAPSARTHIYYQPDRNYSGPDAFVVHVTYLGSSTGDPPPRYETDINYDVDVVKHDTSGEASAALASAGAGTEFTLTWITVTKVIQPDPGLYKNTYSWTIHVSPDKQVNWAYFENGKLYSSARGALGAEFQISTSHAPPCPMRVDAEGRRLVFASDCPSHRILTTITPAGHQSCVAARRFELKPGHSYFEYADDNRGVHSASDLHTEDVTCSSVEKR